MGKEAAATKDKDDDEDNGPLVRGPTPPPKAAPKPATKEVQDPRVALREAVVIVDTQVKRVSHAGVKERAGLIPVAAKEIAQHLRYVEAVFGRKSLDQAPSLRAPLQQLAADIAELFRLGRLSHVHMREAHLEAVFDLEDSIRLQAGLERVGRAEKYYDDNTSKNTSLPDTSSRTSDENTAGDHLGGKTGSPDKKPATRDDLVNHIMDQAHEIRTAVTSGLKAANAAITAPTNPKQPELLEALLQVALGFVFVGIDAALGKLISAGFKRVDKLVGIERTLFEHVGADVKGIVVDSFKDTIKKAINVTVGHPRQPGGGGAKLESDSKLYDNSKLEPKQRFLGSAEQTAGVAIDAAKTRYTAYQSELRRMPLSTLTKVYDAFDDDVKEGISTTFRDRLILEWTNFVKIASERGAMNAGRSKLDQGLDPSGVLTIDMVAVRQGPLPRPSRPKETTGSKLDGLEVDDNRRPPVSALEVRDARLHGMGDAVVENLQGLKDHTLQSVPLHRRVQIAVDDHMFTVTIDHEGVVTVPNLRPDQYRALRELGGSVPDAIKSIRSALHRYKPDRIHG